MNYSARRLDGSRGSLVCFGDFCDCSCVSLRILGFVDGMWADEMVFGGSNGHVIVGLYCYSGTFTLLFHRVNLFSARKTSMDNLSR